MRTGAVIHILQTNPGNLTSGHFTPAIYVPGEGITLLPGINGLEFVAKLKARHEYRFVPVLMLTTEASDTCREAGRAAGAKAWMVKPFQPAALCAAVTRLLAA